MLFGRPRATNPEGAQTDGFRFVVQAYDAGTPSSAQTVLWQRTPADQRPPLWTWPMWDEPRWYSEIKPLFAAMRDVFSAIDR